jgi:hypothetical protein
MAFPPSYTPVSSPFANLVMLQLCVCEQAAVSWAGVQIKKRRGMGNFGGAKHPHFLAGFMKSF